jgi:TolB-like protein/DNA-binding winged helix-turn-helix (wHTH) protein/Tfp pilus assembly protein PilF
MQNDSRPPHWRFGVFEVDPASGELRKQGRRIRLGEQSLQVLLALLERPGEVVTRQQLKQRLWPADTFVDFDANLNTAMSMLREALGDSAKNPRFIETLPRRGYRFVASVAEEGPAPSGAATPLPPLPVSLHRRWSLIGVACLGMLMLMGLSYRYIRAPTQTVDSIAVLPLVYSGPQAEGDQEYLADGITSALITELASLGVPNVISETSVMRYRGGQKPLPVIARELGADLLVEGSVLREGSTVRVNAQLIDARSDRHIWARSYQREMDSILELQGEIARAIVREIRSRLSPAAEVKRAPRHITNPPAHEAYLRGRYALRAETEERRSRAPQFFEEATRQDPAFAPAYAGLADYYANTDAVPPTEALPRARHYALKALELDETLAGAHQSLALVSMWGDWDWAAAERGFRRSLDLDPSDTTTRRWYALFLDLIGRPRAAGAQLQRVRELDPVSPGTYHAFAFHLFLARRYDEALAQIRAVQELSPLDPRVFEGLGTLYVYKGAYEEAVAANERAITHWGREPAFLAPLAIARARTGERETAKALLDELHGRATLRHIPPSWFAMIYMNLGDVDRAVQWLETAFRTRDVYLVQLGVGPQFDPIRGDARYAALLRRMNFPEPEKPEKP